MDQSAKSAATESTDTKSTDTKSTETEPSETKPPATNTTATGPAAAKPPEPPPLDVRITLIRGGLTKVKSQIVVGARYDGLAFAGSSKIFDRLLDSWLTRAVDLGVIGSALGQLFPINLAQFHKAGKLNANMLLLAGMGEPGRFAQDGVQFIFSNIVVTIKAIGATQFATPLLGTRRNELAIGDAVRGLVQGIADGYERVIAIANSVTEQKEGFRAVAQEPLSVLIVHDNEQKILQMQAELQQLVVSKQFTKLKLSVARGDDIELDPRIEPSPADVEPDAAVNYLRVTQSQSAKAGLVRAKSAIQAGPKKSPAHAVIDPFPTDIFQFSALSEVSVVPQREQEVNAHLLRHLADRLTKPYPPDERIDQGNFFTNLLTNSGRFPQTDRGSGERHARSRRHHRSISLGNGRLSEILRRAVPWHQCRGLPPISQPARAAADVAARPEQQGQGSYHRGSRLRPAGASGRACRGSRRR
jgi:hypothetical protein